MLILAPERCPDKQIQWEHRFFYLNKYPIQELANLQLLLQQIFFPLEGNRKSRILEVVAVGHFSSSQLLFPSLVLGIIKFCQGSWSSCLPTI